MATPSRKTVTTEEIFATEAAAGATVTIRIMRMSDRYIYDWDDDTFKVNLAACTTGSGPTTEVTDLGDVNYSQFLATVEMTNLNTSSLHKQFMVQFRAGAVIDDTDEIWVAASRRVIGPLLPW